MACECCGSIICCECEAVPDAWTLTITGMTEGGASGGCCDESNGTWTLHLRGKDEEDRCIWTTNEECGGEPIWTLRLYRDEVSELCTMNLFNLMGDVEYGKQNPNCLAANEMFLATPALCNNVPEPVTVSPV